MCVRRILRLALLALLLTVAPSQAQVVGTFRWQTRPSCNLITLTVVQQGGMYQLTGADDLCGSGAAPVTGTAVVTGGGVALGMSVALPSGRAAHLTATIGLPSVSGTWTDADGNTGPFVFTNVANGGAPRPAPTPSVGVATGAFIGGSGLTFNAELVVTSAPFTTDRAGRLFLTRSIAPSITCTTGIAVIFLRVDGVAVPSTASRASTTSTRVTLAGLTDAPVPAGAHALSYGGECTGSGTATSMVVDLLGQLSVLVLP